MLIRAGAIRRLTLVAMSAGLLMVWRLPAQSTAVADGCLALFGDDSPGVHRGPTGVLPDSSLLEFLVPWAARPGAAGRIDRATLDSISAKRPDALFDTIAFLIIEGGYHYGMETSAWAAALYRELGGPPDRLMWALEESALDGSRYLVLLALPDTVGLNNENALLRLACSLAIQIDGLTRVMPDVLRLKSQNDTPQWFYEGSRSLRLIGRHLTGDRAAAFDSLIAPVLQRADAISARVPGG